MIRDVKTCSFTTKECYSGDEQYLSEEIALVDARDFIRSNFKLSTSTETLEIWRKK